MGNDSQKAVDQLDKLDAIRDIIFGEDLKLLENLINQLKKKLDSLNKRVDAMDTNIQHIEKSISENQDDLNISAKERKKTQDSIDLLKKELSVQMKSLADTKVSKSEIGQVFIEWGMKVKQETS